MVLPNPVEFEKTSADLTSATDARTTRFCRTRQPVFAKRLRRARAWVVYAPHIAHEVHLALRPPLRARRRRVHRNPPNVRDDGQRPSEQDGMANHIHLICISEKQKYFYPRDWTGGITLIGLRKSGCTKNRIRPLPHGEEAPLRRLEPSGHSALPSFGTRARARSSG
jgi:hypothetical protein